MSSARILRRSSKRMSARRSSASPKMRRKRRPDLPIVGIVNNILSYALASRASDIHIEILEESTFIRYRIDGILYRSWTSRRRCIRVSSRASSSSRGSRSTSTSRRRTGVFATSWATRRSTSAFPRCPRSMARRWRCVCSNRRKSRSHSKNSA